jgi:hypothetical protein
MREKMFGFEQYPVVGSLSCRRKLRGRFLSMDDAVKAGIPQRLYRDERRGGRGTRRPMMTGERK